MQAGLEFPLRAPRRLTLESGTLINRGLRDVTPKYLDTAKVTGSLLRQIAANHVEDLSSVDVFMPFAGPEAERLSAIFPHASGLSISAPLLGSMIERLYTLTGRTALTIVAATEPPASESLTQFARSLVAHDRQVEVSLLKDLTSRVRDVDLIASKEHRFDREAIIVEERGGKFGQLTLEEPTIRLQLKKWQAGIVDTNGRDHKGEGRVPMDSPPGFGAGAAILSDGLPSTPNKSRSLYFAATSTQLPSSLSVELVAQWKQATHTWLKDLGLPPSALKRVYVSTPFIAVSAFVGQAFAGTEPSAPLLMYPDQIYGWQPLLTLLAMMRQPSLPALFVYGGVDRAVQVAAVWAAP